MSRPPARSSGKYWKPYILEKPNILETQYSGNQIYWISNILEAQYTGHPNILETQYTGNPIYWGATRRISRNVRDLPKFLKILKISQIFKNFRNFGRFWEFSGVPGNILETEYTGNSIYWGPNILETQYTGNPNILGCHAENYQKFPGFSTI